MADKHLRLKPYNISNNVWWYEDVGGIDIHVEPSSKHTTVFISWRQLRSAIKRKDKHAAVDALADKIKELKHGGD